jgi:hypothetical protein
VSEQQELAPKALHVFRTEGNEFWIAVDEADVAGQQEAEHGCTDEPDEMNQLDDDYILKIVWDEDAPDVVEAKTCAAWVIEKGRGLLVACEP